MKPSLVLVAPIHRHEHPVATWGCTGILIRVKLCRFELLESPDQPRSGLVYEGKIYETDGANAIGIHEVSATRLLSPVGQSVAYRLFLQGQGNRFLYLNQAALIGPNDSFEAAIALGTIQAMPALAIIVSATSRPSEPYEADDTLLGLSLATIFFSGEGKEASDFDVAFSIGPAVTTPDELDDRVTEDERGRRYRMKIEFGPLGADPKVKPLDEMPLTPAELVVLASRTRPVRAGDVLLAAFDDARITLANGDETRTAAERLGVLANRLL